MAALDPIWPICRRFPRTVERLSTEGVNSTVVALIVARTGREYERANSPDAEKTILLYLCRVLA